MHSGLALRGNERLDGGDESRTSRTKVLATGLLGERWRLPMDVEKPTRTDPNEGHTYFHRGCGCAVENWSLSLKSNLGQPGKTHQLSQDVIEEVVHAPQD